MSEHETPSLMKRIALLVPAEILGDDERAALFDSFDAAADLRRDGGSLAADLAAHPFRALKWSLRAAAAARQVADLEVELRDTRARLDARTRQTFTDAGVTRATEAMVAALIESDASWHAAQRATHEAAAVARVCADLCELMRQRWDALLGAQARQRAGSLLPGRGATLAEAATLATHTNGRTRPDRTPAK